MATGAREPCGRVSGGEDHEGLKRLAAWPGAILAFGTERHGLSDEVLDRATMRVRIPMRQGVSSLNLATSVSAVLFARKLCR